MALRYFRKNKKMTRWIYIGLTVVVMLTFSVTGSIYDFLSGGTDDVVGAFRTPGGEEVVVRRPEWQRWSQRLAVMSGGRAEDESIWQLMMMDAMAREAGVNPSDTMVHKYGQMLGVDLNDSDQLKQLRKALGIPGKEILEHCRAALRAQLYEDLVAGGGKRIRSEQVYDRFKRDHALYTVDFVHLADADQAASLDKDAVSKEDLQTFLDKELPAVRREHEFSTPEKYVLDAALLSAETATAEALAAKLTDPRAKEVSDTEIENFYDENSERFERPVKAADEENAGEDANEGEDAKEGDDAAEEESDDDSDDDADDDGDDEDVETEPIPLAEVKERIRVEILIGRVINAATESFRTAKQARDAAIEKKKIDEALNPGAASDPPNPADPADPAGQTPAEPTPAEPEEDLLAKVAQEFGLELVSYPDPVSIDDLDTLDRIGGEEGDLAPFVRGLAKGEITTRSPSSKVPYGILLRVKDRIPPQTKPIEEIEAKLRDAWLEENSKKAAEAAAKALDEALLAAARAKVADDVAKREQEAKDAAAKRIEVEKVEDAERKAAIEAEELAKAKPAIDDLVASKKGEVFDEVVKASGHTLQSIPEFRKTYSSTVFYSDEDASPSKFVKGHVPLFMLSPGQMLGPVRDDSNKGYVFAIVRSKREPPFEMMRPGDRAQAEQSLMSDMYSRREPTVDFSFPALAQRLQLRTTES